MRRGCSTPRSVVWGMISLEEGGEGGKIIKGGEEERRVRSRREKERRDRSGHHMEGGQATL